MNAEEAHLSKKLGPFKLWGLGVGYVIAGMFFGWSHGLVQGGVYGLLIATFLMILMYFCFVFSYCELCTIEPDAGGVFVYAHRAFGRGVGYVAGLLQIIEFVFAAPAISLAIAAGLEFFFAIHHPFLIASLCYLTFTTVNIMGINLSARIELIFSFIAVIALSAFFMVSAPHFNPSFLSEDKSSLTALKIFAAIPFAMWFFLGIEGLANVSEETINPQKNMTYGFISAMTTLAILAVLTLLLSVGIGGWQKVVYSDVTSLTSDMPISIALSQIIPLDSVAFKGIVIGGLIGLLASFHGLMLVASRALYKFSLDGFLWARTGELSRKYHTPVNALIINSLIGCIAVYSGKTELLIIISGLAALCCYVICSLSMIRLRLKKPELKRPFRAPFFPVVPLVALLISSLSVLALSYVYPSISFLFFLTVLVLWLYEFKFAKGRIVLRA
jgi:ethanolamine permease